MHLDFSDDFVQTVDNLGPVRLVRRGNVRSGEVGHAYRRPMTTAEAERSDGRYTESDAVWHLPCGELPGEPRLGDVIVDAAGARWTVLEVQHLAHVARWRCAARQLALAHGLDQHVDIEQAVRQKAAGGVVRTTWRPWRTGVAARIQPRELIPTDGADRRGAVARYTIILGENLPLDENHRLRGPDGTRYTITAVRRAQRIDALMEVEATSER